MSLGRLPGRQRAVPERDKRHRLVGPVAQPPPERDGAPVTGQRLLVLAEPVVEFIVMALWTSLVASFHRPCDP
jgi:hypothetical protein